MPVHAFLDENKERRLTVVVATVNPEELRHCRQRMTQLVLPGQSRIHFTKERASRRDQILTVIESLPITAIVYRSGLSTDHHDARPEILRRVVADLATARAHRLVLEQDDSLIASDRAVLFKAVRAAGMVDTFTYDHLRPQSEPLLWIPDALAWCLGRGGLWADRVRPLLGETYDL